jgi:RNA polymerase sigma-70 factor, ECF subfamily
MNQMLARGLRSRTAMITGAFPMHIVREDRDAALVDRLRRHEDAAVEQFVTAYQARAYRLAIGITGSKEDAEEVVQDAFWNVIRKIDTFRGQSAFGSWVYRIVANSACTKLRTGRGQRAEIRLDAVLPVFNEDGRHSAPVVDWSEGLDDPCLRTEVRHEVTAALEALPAHYRAAVVLRDVEGLSCAEVAEVLSISLANARTRVHRARLFIRKRLTESTTLTGFADAIPQPA